MDDDIEGGGDLLAYGAQRQVHTSHQRHCLDAVQRIPRPVGVDGGQRPVVSRVHCLQHVERLAPAHLTHDNAVRPHTQCVDYELPDRHRAIPLHVWGTGLQTHDVTLVRFQFGRVLDGDNSFVAGDEPGQNVQESRLARGRSARYDDVEPRLDARSEKVDHSCGDRIHRDHIARGESKLGELAYADAGPYEGERRNDDIDAGAVRKACIHHWAALVNAPSERRDDAIYDAQHLTRIAKPDITLPEKPIPLDVYLIRTIHQYLSNAIVT